VTEDRGAVGLGAICAARPFTIRAAAPRDAPALVELARAVGSEPEGWLVTTSEWRSVADERRYLKALRRYRDAAVYVAETLSGELVGRLSLARDPHPGSSHVADLGLMVAKQYRRRGIGVALLEQAVDWARGNGVEKLELHVFPHNEAAIRLYERLGFEREGYRRRHYRRADGGYVDAILMALPVQ
jgi:RimJ/RimL family protein N-acetyltransferase